jgi:hypothetical protein
MRFFFCGGLVILLGVFEDVGGSLRCFCGEVVVKCVVKRGQWNHVAARRKVRHVFELFFERSNNASLEQPLLEVLPYLYAEVNYVTGS